MREIKFRVWDKKNKKYYRECDWLSFKPNGIRFMWTDYDSDDTMVTELPRGDYELMQYTGLKDKNGKEIYEGDRVNVFRTDSFIAYHKAVVVYSPNHAAFLVQYEKIAHDGKIKYSSCADWEIEVIGNIWEGEK